MEEKTEVKKKKWFCCDTNGSNDSCGGFAYFLGIIHPLVKTSPLQVQEDRLFIGRFRAKVIAYSV